MEELLECRKEVLESAFDGFFDFLRVVLREYLGFESENFLAMGGEKGVTFDTFLVAPIGVWNGSLAGSGGACLIQTVY